MAVADQDVRPAVVIHVEESAAPAKILRVRSKAGGKGGVLETGIAEIAIERGRVAREIALHDVEIAVHVVIGRRDSHACLRLAVGAESASRFERDIHEFSILFILVKRARGGIIRDVNVRPAIVVEIGGEHA